MMTRVCLAVLVLLCGAASARAQFRVPKADVTTLLASVDVQPGTSVRAAIQVRLPETLHVQSNAPRDPSFIPTTLSIAPPPGVRVTELVYPVASDLVQQGLSEPLSVFEHEFLIGAVFELDATVEPGTLEVPARLRYQACDDKLCYSPQNADLRWTLRVVADGGASGALPGPLDRIAFGTGTEPPPLKPGDVPVFPDVAAATAPTGGDGLAALDRFTVLASTGGYLASGDFLQFVSNAENGVVERGLFEGRGLLAILAIVILGGLALNLTPCVLPMIPINLAVIGGAMALVYGVLGLVVILTAGTFGTINASPWFNVAIAVVFVALALAMFDVITIDFSRFSSGVGTGGAPRGSLMLAFGMGAVAALLAGACVAPVVIQVVLFSSDLYAKGTAIALALPFLLGVGMAVPWPIAGAGLASLPKPGLWMVRVKQAFGVIILATAAYYGYQGYTLFADRWVDPAAVASSVEEKLKAGWHASLAEGLAAAEREQKPVLIDLWATWCKNCLTMDKTTFADPAVMASLDGYVKIKYQAEQPDEEPARAVMQRFEAIGLPTYVILRPKSSSGARSASE